MGTGFIIGLALGAAVSVIILISALIIFAKAFANEAFKEMKEWKEK